MACSDSGTDNVFLPNVLPTAALFSKRRETRIWKGLEFHSYAAGV